MQSYHVKGADHQAPSTSASEMSDGDDDGPPLWDTSEEDADDEGTLVDNSKLRYKGNAQGMGHSQVNLMSACVCISSNAAICYTAHVALPTVTCV